MKSELPSYLKSFDAFKLGEAVSERLRNRSVDPNKQLIELFLDRAQTWLTKLIAAELIADSIGHPCWEGCWNVYLRDFLFKSNFTPTPVSVQSSISVVENYCCDSQMGAILPDLKRLLSRLQLPAVETTRSSPLVSKVEYKRMQPGFNRKKAFGVSESMICAYDPDVQNALEVARLREKSINCVAIDHSFEPTLEGVAAHRILLYRFRSSIRKMDTALDATDAEGRKLSDISQTFWATLRSELFELQELRWFESNRFGIDEETAVLLLSLPKLEVFRISGFEPFHEHVAKIELGEKFVESLRNNGHVVQITIPRYEQELKKRLLEVRPEVLLYTD